MSVRERLDSGEHGGTLLSSVIARHRTHSPCARQRGTMLRRMLTVNRHAPDAGAHPSLVALDADAVGGPYGLGQRLSRQSWNAGIGGRDAVERVRNPCSALDPVVLYLG